jgi:hypothetical protein
MAYNSSIDILSSILSARNGLAKTNRFNVIFSVPGGNTRAAQEIAILCESCSMPTHAITTTDYAPVRHPVKIPTGYSNEDVSFTFLLTSDFHLKNVFDSWLALVVDPISYRIPYQEDYSSDVTIEQLDSENNVAYSVILQKAYPTSISSITLDNSAGDQVQK